MLAGAGRVSISGLDMVKRQYERFQSGFVGAARRPYELKGREEGGASRRRRRYGRCWVAIPGSSKVEGPALVAQVLNFTEAYHFERASNAR